MNDALPLVRGSQVRRARKRLGLSQLDLGRRFGCAPCTISRFERGQQRLSPDDRLRFAAIFAEVEREQAQQWSSVLRDSPVLAEVPPWLRRQVSLVISREAVRRA